MSGAAQALALAAIWLATLGAFVAAHVWRIRRADRAHARACLAIIDAMVAARGPLSDLLNPPPSPSSNPQETAP